MQQLWTTIFLTAILGQHEQARLTIQRLPAHLPAHHHRRLAAISARAHLVMHEPQQAKAQLGWACKDEEGIALRSVMRREAGALARRATAQSPGMAADAACDLAWSRLQRSDHAGAVEAVQHGLARCPEHIEARLWCHFLQAQTLTALGEALTPTAARGWLSPERIRRRPAGSAWGLRPDAALGRLREAGIPLPQLASRAHYATLPSSDSLVSLEVKLEEASALHRAGLPGGALLKSAWMQAQHQPPDIIRQVARVLIELAVRDPSAARVGLAAAQVMRERITCPRLEAMTIRLKAALNHPSALAAARRALRQAAEPEAWALIVTAIDRLGHRDEARSVAERALGTVALCETAYAMLRTWEPTTGAHAPSEREPRTIGALERR